MNDKSADLLACPCGQVPTALGVVSHGGDTPKYAYAYGNCCGEWHIEFRATYATCGSPEMNALAEAAWNNAPRSDARKGAQSITDDMVARAAGAYARAAESEGYRSTEGMETHLRWMRTALAAVNATWRLSPPIDPGILQAVAPDVAQR